MKTIQLLLSFIAIAFIIGFAYHVLVLTFKLILHGTSKSKKNPRIGRDSWPIPRSFRPSKLGQANGRWKVTHCRQDHAVDTSHRAEKRTRKWREVQKVRRHEAHNGVSKVPCLQVRSPALVSWVREWVSKGVAKEEEGWKITVRWVEKLRIKW